MTRVYAWLQRHPTLVDGVMAAALLLFGAVGALQTLHDGSGRGSGTSLGAVAALFIGLPILLRRSLPTVAFCSVCAIGTVQVFTSSTITPSDLAVPAALYALAAYRERRVSLPGFAVCLLGAALALARWVNPTTPLRWTQQVIVYGVLSAPVVIAWVLGDSMRYRRAYYVELEDRARRLERERDQQAQIGAAAERARIARELHDVVAHNVSVMVVQAEGATYAFDSAPDSARQALGAIAQTGRSALAEMRRLLGVLRSEDGEADRAPQPGVEQLEDLLNQVRATGLAVDFTVDGVPVALPQGMELAAYRIVQESLTNTRRHGGPRVSAKVALHYGESALRMLVCDNGRGGAALTDGQGNGLMGMRERVAMYGGSVLAGPRPEGGFRVEAVLPYQAATAMREAAA